MLSTQHCFLFSQKKQTLLQQHRLNSHQYSFDLLAYICEISHILFFVCIYEPMQFLQMPCR